MTVEVIQRFGTWNDVRNAARTTIGKEDQESEPSDAWKRKILRAEHSPIRYLMFDVVFHDLPYWVSVHLVRHKHGIEHFVKTQRSDRTGIPRGSLLQSSPVEHRMLINSQALIFISRKRLCRKASPETRGAWLALINAIHDIDPIISSACVPDCIYRGGCHEMEPCGYVGAIKDALC
jgi:hypothetical protein